MPLVSVDIDLDEFENQDLLAELERRVNGKTYFKKLDKEEKVQLLEIAGLTYKELGSIKTKTLPDQMKIEFLTEHFDKITLEQLESLLK